jgi:hypothetical protein
MINYLPGLAQQDATSEASVAKDSGKGKEGN